MQDMRRAGFEDEARKGADEARALPVPLLERADAGVLRVHPAIAGGNDRFARPPRRPAVGCAIIIGEEALHSDLRRLRTAQAGGDAVGDDAGDALARQVRSFGHERAVEVLVLFLAAGGRILAEADGEGFAVHRKRAEGGHVRHGPPSFDQRRGQAARAGAVSTSATAARRLRPVRTWVEYSIMPVKVRPPTRLPSTTGISFHSR